MSKKSENLSDLDKKDRNKRHSSPFINIVKGNFFVVHVTLVPVSYLSAPSAVHSYRVPGKFIRIVRIKQKFIRIAYLYSKCTDCRINIQYIYICSPVFLEDSVVCSLTFTLMYKLYSMKWNSDFFKIYIYVYIWYLRRKRTWARNTS